MSDAWNDLQEFKNKQNSRRERLQRRKIEREGLVFGITADTNTGPTTTGNAATGRSNSPAPIQVLLSAKSSDIKLEPDIEQKLLACLCDASLDFPVHSRALTSSVSKLLNRDVQDASVEFLLQKFAAQELICIKEGASPEGKACIVIITAEHNKLVAFANEVAGNHLEEEITSNKRKRKSVSPEKDEPAPREIKKPVTNFKSDESIENLLSLPSTREKETKKMGEEILDLLSKPTAKERSLVEKFKSQGGAQVQEFCPHGIKEECMKMNQSLASCRKLHFKKILQKHTDESLGDCSFLNTCFHMDTCKYVHYEVDYSGSSLYGDKSQRLEKTDIINSSGEDNTMKLYPPQWIQCDLRFFDMSILGKFAVVMADPPWDIHMELPYGTMSDDEMRQLAIPSLQEEGLIFLWVTGRAMELGRECLKLWGYDRCDELIWVKTNQLQRIIRTGRTGHWLNHGKEHCLVGMKGDPSTINRGLDCDVIVAEVRATSHKPDEIYGIIERLSPGTRKIELFGRPHNVQPNWITLGNQLDGVKLLDPDLIKRFKKHFPDGNCMKPPKKQ